MAKAVAVGAFDLKRVGCALIEWGLYRASRQVDIERGSAADDGIDFDSAFVVLDDFLADREAQARAFGFAPAGGSLGGEEGLEDLGDELFGDAGAGIDYLDLDFI